MSRVTAAMASRKNQSTLPNRASAWHHGQEVPLLSNSSFGKSTPVRETTVNGERVYFKSMRMNQDGNRIGTGSG